MSVHCGVVRREAGAVARWQQECRASAWPPFLIRRLSPAAAATAATGRQPPSHPASRTASQAHSLLEEALLRVRAAGGDAARHQPRAQRVQRVLPRLHPLMVVHPLRPAGQHQKRAAGGRALQRGGGSITATGTHAGGGALAARDSWEVVGGAAGCPTAAVVSAAAFPAAVATSLLLLVPCPTHAPACPSARACRG